MSEKKEAPYEVLFYPDNEKNPSFTLKEFTEMVDTVKQVADKEVTFGKALIKKGSIMVYPNSDPDALFKEYEELKAQIDKQEDEAEEGSETELLADTMKSIYG